MLATQLTGGPIFRFWVIRKARSSLPPKSPALNSSEKPPILISVLRRTMLPGGRHFHVSLSISSIVGEFA